METSPFRERRGKAAREARAKRYQRLAAGVKRERAGF